MTADMPTQDEWTARIEPVLHQSLEDVSERITSAPPIQRWLQEASFKAAEGWAGTAGMQARAAAHARMLDDLHTTFAPLVDAVEALTFGYGHLDLNWRPLAPNYSRVYVAFDRDFEVDLFYRLVSVDPETAREVLAILREALPAGEPFINRPNEATALVARKGRSVGVRLQDHRDEKQTRWQSVILFPERDDPIKNIDVSALPRRLVQLMADAER